MIRFLIVFAKEAQRGAVKTRLRSYLSEEQCVNLYKSFLKDTVDIARKINCETRIMAYESNGKSPEFLKKISNDFKFYKQKGKNLGQRLYNAFKFAAKSGSSKTVIIGSDSPDLPKSYINKAFNKLNNSDLVLGPAYDGGYYLIGLREPCKEIFENIKWSSSSVFKQTLEKAKKARKKVAVLGLWHDIDTPQDLKYLKKII